MVVKANKIESEFENIIVATMLTIKPIRRPVTVFFILKLPPPFQGRQEER
jgi:hypothetical protein